VLDFRLLGPLEVVEDGRPVALGGPRPRALLAILLLHRGQVVSSDRLVEELWGERPPATAPKTIQVYISHLRKALGSDVLVTRGGGYVLLPAPEQVDSERFEALVEEARRRLADGDARGARELLSSALGLWRGEPLADLAYEPFAQAEIARVADARLAALEDRIEADLALGRHRALVSELEALVRQHPNRERLLAQLMLALYRSGRQADALAAYRAGQRLLQDELGLDPGPELRLLERRILDHDPALELAAQRERPSMPPDRNARAARSRCGGALIAAGGAVLLAAAALAGALVVLSGGGHATILAPPNSVAAIATSSDTIDQTIPVRGSPSGIAVGEGAVWVANTDNSTVSRVDPRTHTVRQDIRVGAGPTAVAVGHGAVWVANGADGTVARIDPTTNDVAGGPIRVGNGPTGVAYGEGAVWVANSVDGTVSRIDPSSGRVTGTFPAVLGAAGVAVGFGRVWVVSPSAGTVVSLDPRSGDIVDRVAVGADPDAVVTDAKAVWVANRGDGTVSRITPTPTAHVAATTQVGRGPDALAISGDSVWVANADDRTLARIDASDGHVVKSVPLGNPPQGLAVSRASVYATLRSSVRAHRGGRLRIVSDPPDSIDPAVAFSYPAWALVSITNDGLLGFRRVGGIEGVQLVPDLAVSLPTLSDGGRTYTFRLRRGVRYSTGRSVEPADLRRAIERIFEIKQASGARAYFEKIAGASGCRPVRCDLSRGIATDNGPRTITFHLTAPDAGFLAKLAMPWAVAVPSTTTPASDSGAHALPATGPYMVAAYHKNRGATLVRNPRFREWSRDAQPDGYPDVLSWTFQRSRVPRPLLQVRAVTGGRADVAPKVVPLAGRQLGDLATRFPSQLRLSPGTSTTFFALNTRAAPFDDLSVRRAVNYAFDQHTLARRDGLGYAPTCQFVPPDFPAYRRICPYGTGGGANVERAQRLVGSRAGMTVTVWVPSTERTDGRYMVSVLDTLHFRARLKSIADAHRWFQTISAPRSHVQVAWDSWIPNYPSEVSFLPEFFSCSAATSVPTGFCDPRVDRALSAAATGEARNPAEASALWQKAEREILAQAPIVPMYNGQEVSFVSKRVGGVEYNPQWGVLLDQLWVRRTRRQAP
jgi:DNA-binding SARP family transcriptional activator/ABC-type transport system substrate-binding protein/DNA-binding beta-propeller fold protein YncE